MLMHKWSLQAQKRGKQRSEQIAVMKAMSWTLVSCIMLSATMCFATDRGVSWGTVSVGSGAPATASATNHALDGQTAIIVDGGSDTLLPGATLNSVGVLNEINVVGDNNLVDATQTGTNSGNVTTTVNLGN